MTNFKNAFGWDIKQTPIYNLQGEVINGYKSVTRDDDASLIAVMKNSYTPMTTQEFTNTAEAVAAKIGCTIQGYEDWNTKSQAGRSQHIITAQLKVSKPLNIGGSEIQGFLTLGVGFDGSRSFFIGHTDNYLRCTNEFGTIIKDFTSRLTKNNLVRVDEIIKSVESYEDYEKKLYDSFKKFQDVKIDERIIKACVSRLVGLTKEEILDSKLITTQKLNRMDDIMASVRTECSELGNNTWGLFNAVTHYSSHIMDSKGQEMFGNMFGAKGAFNKKGYEFCLETAGLM